MSKYEKDRRKQQEQQVAGQARAARQAPQAHGAVDMGLLRSGVQDYVRNMGTPTMHVIDHADRAGIDHGRLKEKFHVPAAALDMLPTYRAQPAARRKEFSIDMPKDQRQKMIGAFADFTGVPVPGQ